MLVVMRHDATPSQVENVVQVIRDMGLTPHPMPGATRTAIGMTGNTQAVDPRRLEVVPGVLELIRVTKPYKLASREMHADDTVARIPLQPATCDLRHSAPPNTVGKESQVAGRKSQDAEIGPGTFTIIAGPCSVESEDQILRTAEFLMSRGVRLLRAGAFKPRTSPYSFQGMEHEGLKILEKARSQTGIGVVTEVMDTDNAAAIEQVADVMQIGARNMQNFSLLKRVAKCKKPLLLKRGMSATLDELLMSAEYLLAGGNKDVILCERGVRTFADHTRNTLDLSIIPPVRQLSHLPILADPSHGTGHRAYVPAMCLASLAAGAHGLLLEVHPQPEQAKSDGAQSLSFAEFDAVLEKLKRLAEPLGVVVS